VKTVFWETTKLCNMNCRHCSNDSGLQNPEELSSRETILLCDQLIDIGLKDFRFYGGEPFLRKDISEIVQFLSSRNIKITFYTNGTIINEDILALLKSVANPRIAVSLDGASPKTHDEIRGSVSFDVVLHNIALLVSMGYQIDIIFTISKKNYKETDKVFLLGKNLGVSSIKPNIISKIGRAKTFWNEFALSPKQLAEVAKTVLNGNLRYFGKKGIRKPCVAGIEEIYVSSNGNIFPCALLLDQKFCAGNIRNASISEILLNPSPGFSQIVKSIQNKEFCVMCTHKVICQGGCRARAMSEQDNIYAKDTFSCLYYSFVCKTDTGETN